MKSLIIASIALLSTGCLGQSASKYSGVPKDIREYCPADWINWTNQGDYGCYKVLLDKVGLTVAEAHAECEAVGGILAEPKHGNMATYLNGILNIYANLTGVNNYFIALSDADEEGSWMWTGSNEALDSAFYPWGPGSPNKEEGNVDDCVAIWVTEGYWSFLDTPCQSTMVRDEKVAPLCQYIL